jgi:hypothetical protein
MNNAVLEVGASPLGGEGARSLVEAEVQAAFNLLAAELEAVPGDMVEVLDRENRAKIYGGNDPNFLTHRHG